MSERILRIFGLIVATYLMADAWILHSLLPQFSWQSRSEAWSLDSSVGLKAASAGLFLLLLSLVVARRPLSTGQLLVGGGAFVYLLACIGTALSAGQDLLTATGAWNISMAILAGVACSRLCGDATTATRVVRCVIVAVAIHTILTYNSREFVIWSGNLARAGGPFKRPEIVATLLAATLPWTLAGLFEESPRNPLPGVMEASVSVAALTLTWMRNAFAAVGLGLVLITARERRWKLTLPIIVVTVALSLLTFTMRTSGPVRSVSTQKSNRGHMIAWQKGLKEFARKPVTGIGVSALSISIPKEGELDPTKNDNLTEPKSIYIALLADLGISGILVLLAIPAGLFLHFRKANRQIDTLLLSAWLVLGFLGIFDTVVLSDRYAANLLLGVLLGCTLFPTTTERDHGSTG